MAEKTPDVLAELVTRLGPPDASLGFSPVPSAYKEALGGAEFACEHIAMKGAPGGSTGRLHGKAMGPLSGKLLALCPECSTYLQNNFKAAKAGK